MTSEEKQQIRVFLWGRIIPDRYRRLRNLSKPTEKDYIILKHLIETGNYSPQKMKKEVYPWQD